MDKGKLWPAITWDELVLANQVHNVIWLFLFHGFSSVCQIIPASRLAPPPAGDQLPAIQVTVLPNREDEYLSWNLAYSSRRVCIGLILAAFMACAPTVIHEMSKANRPAKAKYHHSIAILSAKLFSQLDTIR